MDKIKAYEELLNRTLNSLRAAAYYDRHQYREADKLYDDIKKALSEPVIDNGWIRATTETTGNNVATVDYQTTGEFINFDNIEEMTEI